MKVTQRQTFPYSWDKVADVMIDSEFNVELEQLREGVISAEFKMLRDDDKDKQFEIRTTEYKRKKTGGIDKSGTVQTYTTSRYNGSSRRLSWEYHGEAGKMMVIKGVYSLMPLGDEKTVFEHEVTIEVKIPLIGKQIAKLIAKDFETQDGQYEKLWKKYLER